MRDDLKMIPSRIRELREILDLSAAQMAERLLVTPEEYAGYEDGSVDISISMLYEIAAILQVDFTVLLTGEAPRMENQCVVKKGEGVSVDRHAGYTFSSLAYNYIGRVMEPLLVTISPAETPPAMIVHTGQEFNYILSGKVRVTVGNRDYLLEAGDCIYFNPQLPHGQEAVDAKATFLTVIKE